MSTTASEMRAPAQRSLPLRERGGLDFLEIITESWVWKNFILLCIILNAIALGIDAHFGTSNPWHAYIEQADNIFLMIFTVELITEFLAQGWRRYWRNGWNWFDVIVVGMCYLAYNPAISALRTLRVVRVFRLISNVPQMRRVVEALFGAMPGIFATMAVLAVVFYISAVMGTILFGAEFPEYFGGLGVSAMTLFQLTLFDDWGSIVGEVSAKFEYAWAYFMIFTVLAAFAVMNLFIGVIVEAVQQAGNAEIKEEVQEIEEDVEDIAEAQEDAAVVQKRILEEVVALRAELAALKGQAPQT